MTTDETRNRATAGHGLSITCQQYGSRSIIELSGELDLNGSDHLVEQLQEILPTGVNRVEIDAARVTFTDSSGLRAVLWARTAASAQGVEFEVTAVSPRVERVISMAGLRDILLAEE